MITRHAVEHHSTPSQVYADYQEHPRDYQLMWSWEEFAAEREKKAMEEERNKQGSMR